MLIFSKFILKSFSLIIFSLLGASAFYWLSKQFIADYINRNSIIYNLIELNPSKVFFFGLKGIILFYLFFILSLLFFFFFDQLFKTNFSNINFMVTFFSTSLTIFIFLFVVIIFNATIFSLLTTLFSFMFLSHKFSRYLFEKLYSD